MRESTRTPEMKSAHEKVFRAVRKGILPRLQDSPCFDCGKQAKEYDHHNGYDAENVLNVQAVCLSCHQKRSHSRRPYPRYNACITKMIGPRTKDGHFYSLYARRLQAKERALHA